MAEYPVVPLIRIRGEMMYSPTIRAHCLARQRKCLLLIAEILREAGEDIMPDIHTLKALAVESHPPTAIPPGGIRPVVNEKLAEIERGRNNLLSATEKMMREYCHPLDERSFSMKGMIDSIPISFTLDQMLTDVGLTLPGGEA